MVNQQNQQSKTLIEKSKRYIPSFSAHYAKFEVQVKSEISIEKILIYDNFGRPVNVTASKVVNITLTDYAKGVYTFKIV